MPESETICLANFKGGVGKSTTAVNLAAALVEAGHRTLLADCDPQANTSEMFIPEHDIEFDFRSIIADKVPVQKVVQSTRMPLLDLLPASFDLAYLDKELVVSPAGVQRIDKALRPIRRDYDFIILDTGPNLSHLTLGALVAARHIMIPVSATVWSTAGLRKFVRWIDAHREDEVITAHLLGLVATIVQARTRIGRSLLADLPAGPFPAFKTYIPRRIGAEDAAFNQAIVGDDGADLTLTTAYRDLAKEVVKEVRRIRAQEGRHHVQ